MRDPRAVRDMIPDDIWNFMPPDPEIKELELQRASLKGDRYQIKGRDDEKRIRELTNQIRTKRAQREEKIRTEYREYYFHNRPTWDIEKQAMGEAEEEYAAPAIELDIPERAKLAEILVNQSEDIDYQELLQLRIRAADLMTALSCKRETVKSRCIKQQAQGEVGEIMENSPKPDPFPLVMERTQCPCCIGDVRLSHEERTFKYCRPSVMYDHFDRDHMKELESAKQILCGHPKCKREAFEFDHLNHFKNHVERVHGVKLRKQASRGRSLLTASSSKSKTDWGNGFPGSYAAGRSASDALLSEASFANVDPRLLAWDESEADRVPAGRGADEGEIVSAGNNLLFGCPASDTSSTIPVLAVEESSAIAVTSSGTSTPSSTTTDGQETQGEHGEPQPLRRSARIANLLPSQSPPSKSLRKRSRPVSACRSASETRPKRGRGRPKKESRMNR